MADVIVDVMGKSGIGSKHIKQNVIYLHPGLH